MGDAYPAEEVATVKRAIEAGVHTLMFPNVDTGSIKPLLDLRNQFPDNVFAAMGLHPTEVKHNWQEQLETIKPYLAAPGVIALGEIGMDLYHDDSMRSEQEEAFRTQLGWARDLNLPVILHQRGALDLTLDILKEEYTSEIPAIVFHCFTEGPKSVSKIKQVIPEAFFGIGGVVTFKNASALREALHSIGLDHIVLETDAPWMAPTPHRGSRNESAYIPLIAERIAQELYLPLTEVETQTDLNARKLFPGMTRL
ncbi:MAG: TatD family hydrolase [Muribaculaceae bacterium]|nr:TatD family hydrolase [Muribaculaceae bacterium]